MKSLTREIPKTSRDMWRENPLVLYPSLLGVHFIRYLYKVYLSCINAGVKDTCIIAITKDLPYFLWQCITECSGLLEGANVSSYAVRHYVVKIAFISDFGFMAYYRRWSWKYDICRKYWSYFTSWPTYLAYKNHAKCCCTFIIYWHAVAVGKNIDTYIRKYVYISTHTCV